MWRSHPQSLAVKCRSLLQLVFTYAALATTVCIADAANGQRDREQPDSFRVMSFNILQGAGEAANVGFANRDFGGSRVDEVAAVVLQCEADIVGVQEDVRSSALLEALGADWQRRGSVYSRFPLTTLRADPYLTVVDVELPSGVYVRLVNCHWWPAHGYGPDLVQAELRSSSESDNDDKVGRRIAEACAIPVGPRGYSATLDVLKSGIEERTFVILTGDFNEPSHLDWTARYAHEGRDRWVENPTETPLRMVVPWQGSRLLGELGMSDSYRQVHPNEVEKPGFTWTPEYPQGTRGRRPFGEQVLARIDRIYHHGIDMSARYAAVVGGNPDFAEIVTNVQWPSDHRAVVVEFCWSE